ncbi:MAG: hypothetical protein GKR92_04550 [Gammaproteobacteria bacterium]|nr:MAG: hypothetical protein GKR92_04550 [Gammaproteobacteria bacterium]
MRLWSIHPKYLDTKGLVALWREALLAQKVLKGETQGYRNHPQLDRFKSKRAPIFAIGKYLYHIHQESLQRGYSFNVDKIDKTTSRLIMDVNIGQLEYERRHLLVKLKSRDRPLYFKVRAIKELDAHPFFRIVTGGIESWEVMK